jgi:ribosomal protein S18
MLKDESDWVQSNAIAAIGSFDSSLSTSAIPTLQAIGDAGSEALKTHITETINKIKQGGTDARKASNQQQVSRAIEQYIEQRNPRK